MKQLTPIEIHKSCVLKAFRAAIRLKYSLLADREIAERLPKLEKDIDQALAMGVPLELDPATIFDGVDF